MKCAVECGLDTKSGLSLDVSTRWNSTHLMLRDVVYYKLAFERLKSYAATGMSIFVLRLRSGTKHELYSPS